MSLPVKTLTAAALAALFAVFPTRALAQEDANRVSTGNYIQTQPKENNDFPWGLFGLIGLAGFIPRGKKERDIHVDARSRTGN